MTEMELYKLWCEKAVDDPDLQTELKSIEGDADAIQDRFYRDLEFGTGGLRGVIGAGAYRLNVYTISRATQGLADLKMAQLLLLMTQELNLMFLLKKQLLFWQLTESRFIFILSLCQLQCFLGQ